MKRVITAWRCRWGVARLALACMLVWVLATDMPARLARVQLAALPDADFVAEIRSLSERGRFGEALVVADAGLETAIGERRAAIERERERVQAQQQSAVRRLKDVVRGAITGGGPPPEGGEAGPDPSLELLAGAVVTDLFVVGDIRDLVIQGGRWARGDKTDPVLAALAGVGLLTTLAPEIDWAPSLLKGARKSGSLTNRFAEFLTSAVKGRKTDVLKDVMSDTAAIARHASPAGAVRLMKHVDSAEDAARLARFLERNGARGAHALRVTGDQGVEMVRAAESLRSAGRADEAVRMERVLLAASAKGPDGAKWLGKGLYRPLLRPHPVVGIIKSVWKGNAQALVARALEALDPFSIWMLPAAAAWAFFELAVLIRRLGWVGAGARRRVATAVA